MALNLSEAIHVSAFLRMDAVTCTYVPSKRQLTHIFYRHHQSEPMVRIRRSGLHHRRFGDGAGHGTRTRIPLLRTRAKKIRLEHDMGVYGVIMCDHVSVVFLGIFAGL